MFEHDFKLYPELRNNELKDLEFISPHIQLKEDFYALVVKVHDGDTITLRIDKRDFDFPLRIAEIDTKELNADGEEAGDYVRNLIEGQEVYIILDEKRVEKWGRLLGKVIFKGVDVGKDLIQKGLAVPYEERNTGKIIDPIERDATWQALAL